MSPFLIMCEMGGLLFGLVLAIGFGFGLGRAATVGFGLV